MLFARLLVSVAAPLLTDGIISRNSIVAAEALSQANDANNNNLVLPPLASTSGLQDKLLVFIPGANVPTSYYEDTATAIQNATDGVRLWVVVPAIFDKLCITICPTADTCFMLQDEVDKLIGTAKTQGYKGPTQGEGVYLSGHSLGTTCADNLVRGYPTKYQALVVMGGYVHDQDVAKYTIPVLTLGGELDGLVRPGTLFKSVQSSDSWAQAAGDGINSVLQVTKKPVVILKGVDHSDFCHGFHVPNDIYPSEVTKAEAMSAIGGAVSAFLHLQCGLHTTAGVATLQDGQSYTRDNLLKPMADAMAFTGELSPVENGKAPWCEIAQIHLAGIFQSNQTLQSDPRLILSSLYKTGELGFTNSHVHYAKSHTGSDASTVQFNISGHNNYIYGDPLYLSMMCLVPAQEIGCKMASADRVAQQLGLSKDQYNSSVTCKDVNQYAIAVAEKFMEQTTAGRHALERFKEKGRPICLGEDFAPLGDIGPLWVAERLSVTDEVIHHTSGKITRCRSVKSVREGPTGLDSAIFPGVHYCKLLSPARVIEYYQSDALKNVSTCLA